MFPKPNKDIDNDTSYRSISLLSVIADTGEEYSSLHNSKHTHATWVQNTTPYSDGTTHIKQHRNKGVQPMAPPARTITIALNMSKILVTINTH